MTTSSEDPKCATQRLPLKVLVRDDAIQPRVKLDAKTVADYAALMREGEQFPPIVVFRDGAAYLVADGFHRAKAAEEAGHLEIAAVIRPGTRQDAMIYACGANRKHGLRLTNDDKNQIVNRFLDNEDAKPAGEKRLKQEEIARHCGVTQAFVSKLITTKRKQQSHPYNGYKTSPSPASHHSLKAAAGYAPVPNPPRIALPIVDVCPAIADEIVTRVMDYVHEALADIPATTVQAGFEQAVAELRRRIFALPCLTHHERSETP